MDHINLLCTSNNICFKQFKGINRAYSISIVSACPIEVFSAGISYGNLGTRNLTEDEYTPLPPPLSFFFFVPSLPLAEKADQSNTVMQTAFSAVNFATQILMLFFTHFVILTLEEFVKNHIVQEEMNGIIQ